MHNSGKKRDFLVFLCVNSMTPVLQKHYFITKPQHLLFFNRYTVTLFTNYLGLFYFTRAFHSKKVIVDGHICIAARWVNYCEV